jgi:serine/threonine protein kinase
MYHTSRTLIQDFGCGQGGLPEPVVAKYARQLLLGIAFLHYNNIAHRDLKSANILVAENAQG